MRDIAPHEWLRPPQGTADIPCGTVVRDLATGRVGVLQDVTPYAESDRPAQVAAFLRPLGGGREWTTDPDRIVKSDGGLPALVVEAAAGGQASGSTSGCVNRTGLPSDRA